MIGNPRVGHAGAASVWMVFCAGTALACSHEDGPEVGQVHQRSSVDPVLDFEDASQWSTSNGQLSSSGTSNSGSFSLRADVTGYTQIESVALSSLGVVQNTASLYFRPEAIPSWGEVRLILRAPSLNEYWRDLGGVSIAGSTAGSFRKLEFQIPEALRTALGGTYSDLTMMVVVNGPPGTYLLDSLSLGQQASGPSLPPAPDPPTPMMVFESALQAGVVLAASDWLEVGDRVVLRTSTGSPAPLANSGDGTTKVGVEAQVGSIWSAGPVDLRDRAVVQGNVSAPSVTTGQNSSVSGVVEGPPSDPTRNMTGVPEELEQLGGDIHLEPGQQEHLEPGAYGHLMVKPGATVFLRSGGTYKFKSFTAESNASVVELSTECEPVLIHVEDSFIHRGTLNETSVTDPLGLLIFYEGQSTAHVESPFVGSILAPNAELNLTAANHVGRFLAKRLRVQAGATITDPPPLAVEQQECLADASQAPDLGETPPAVRDIGPAPPLDGPGDLPDFIQWFLKIRREHVEEAKQAITAASDQDGLLAAAISSLASSTTGHTKGLMLLEFIGALTTPAVDTFLVGFVEAPFASQDVSVDTFDPYDLELSYRGQAMWILLGRNTTSGLASVRGIALGHPDKRYRGRALSLLKIGRSE